MFEGRLHQLYVGVNILVVEARNFVSIDLRVFLHLYFLHQPYKACKPKILEIAENLLYCEYLRTHIFLHITCVYIWICKQSTHEATDIPK